MRSLLGRLDQSHFKQGNSMPRATIDYGIDLGTTNSAIAVLQGTTSDVIPNNVGNEITPSAVFFGKNGQEYVGQIAKDRQKDERVASDVCIEFKRRMGTDHLYEFKSGTRAMRPEEVSACVLINLRGDVRQKLGEDVQAAVITVPAAFEARQCAATKMAGELAGFSQCALLQEPVAAALAYGFQADVAKEYWLVYDFGGGTFDAAVIKAEDGSISVVNHGGNNYLGGSDIDWAILDQLVIPMLKTNFNLPELKRGNRKWITQIAILKNAIETAKISLSRSDTAYPVECKFKDAAGSEIEIEFELTRAALIRIAEPIVLKSVEICKSVLSARNLSPRSIEKVILVGGPTLAPYFREMLQSSLGIRLDHSINALTVVAKGAAVFAGTQRIQGNSVPVARPGQFDIQLTYDPIGADADPTVSGRVSVPSSASVAGFTVEFVHQVTGWTSGLVRLRADGRFRTKLVAEKGGQNIYAIRLVDNMGAEQASVPDSISYTIGVTINEQALVNSVAVARANNEADVFFSRGAPLPARARRTYHSTHLLARGSSESILNIPVVEGEESRADRNRLLGKLVISGTQARHDVPAGAEIEVSVDIDTSRIIRVKAYVPILDEEFEASIVYNGLSPSHQQLMVDHNAEVSRFASLRDKAIDAVDESGTELLDELGDLDEMKTLIDLAEGVPEAAEQAQQQLLALMVKLDRVEDALEWPALVARAREAVDELDANCREHGDAESRGRVRQIRMQVTEAIEQNRAEHLRRMLADVNNLNHEILSSLPEYWVGLFRVLVNKLDQWGDHEAAQHCIGQGHEAISQGNVEGVRNAVTQLFGLLPGEKAKEIERGYQSGVN